MRRRIDGHTELDGSLLQSLSIDDSQYTTADTIDEDDYMDIDETEPELQYSTPEPGIDLSEEFTPIQSSSPDDSYDFEESSLSMILSPTTLGAKLAINKPKLIMAAGALPDESTHSVDYEYDLDEYKYKNKNKNKNNGKSSIKSNTANISSYSSDSDLNSFINRKYDDSDNTDEFIYNPKTGQYEGGEDQTIQSKNQPQKDHQSENFNLQGNNNNNDLHSNNNLFNRQQYTPYPVQIHHHHYYYESPKQVRKPPKNSPKKTIKRTPKKGIQRDCEQSLQSAKQSTNISNQSIGQSNNQPEHTNQHNLSTILPLPWESRAHPVETYYYFLSSISQLLTNFLIGSFIIFQLYLIIRSVKLDINNKLTIHRKNLIIEIERATRQYIENECSPDLIVPALEVQCANWEKIMNLDPNSVGNISLISAETIGMILNGLIEPLGIKFIMILFGLVIIIYVCNFSFGYLRAKNYYGWEEKHGQEIYSRKNENKRKYW